MSLADTVRRTEAYLRAETAAQESLLARIEEQERAVRRGDTAEVLRANQRYEEELRGSATREAERRQALRELGAYFGVDPKTLTLSSVVERLGPHAGSLPAARKHLRDATVGVLRASRRLGSVARYHRSVVEEVLGLLQADDAPSSDGRGTLVHVEA